MYSKPMPSRRLGKDGPVVPAVGLGMISLVGAYGVPPNDEERFRFLDRALELGATFWDTADIYFDSEKLLGKWFRQTGMRDKIFLASKFGVLADHKSNSSAEYCKKACEASLKNLGTDRIDLYYVHRVNPVTPIEETMRALVELQAESKIIHIGLSEVSSTTLRRAYKIAPIAAVQIEYSPFTLEIENATGTDLLKTCRDLGVTVVAYSPLGRGLLTGTFTSHASANGPEDKRGGIMPRFSKENIDANIKIVNGFKAFADKKGCTTSQLALAWLLKQGEDIIPIPGTKRIQYLEENCAATDIHLTDDEEAEIRKFAQGTEMLGHRLPDISKDLQFADTQEEV